MINKIDDLKNEFSREMILTYNGFYGKLDELLKESKSEVIQITIPREHAEHLLKALHRIPETLNDRLRRIKNIMLERNPTDMIVHQLRWQKEINAEIKELSECDPESD